MDDDLCGATIVKFQTISPLGVQLAPLKLIDNQLPPPPTGGRILFAGARQIVEPRSSN